MLKIGEESSAKITILKVVSCLILFFLFMWPAIYNGQPLLSPDTSAYIRGFDAGIVRLTGLSSAWTTWAGELAQSQETSVSGQPGEAKSLQSPTFVIAGRSVSYGALLYLGELLGELWASVGVQAAAALIALILTLRHFSFFSWPNLMVVGVAIGLLSSLPFVVSYLVPDVFAGLLLLATANLLAVGNRMKRWELIFWVSTSAAAAVFHPTHLAILSGVFVAALIVRLFSTRLSVVGMAALGLATAIGFASEIGFDLAVKQLLGVHVSRPPVLLARIIADGPGAAYLRERCPEARLVVCEYTERLVANADAFLWDTSSDWNVYASAPVEKRRALGDEQYRFAAAVLAYDPVGQIAASLGNTFQQLKMVGISGDFLLTVDHGLPNLPQLYTERMASSPIWRKEFPIGIVSALMTFTVLMSLIFITAILPKYWGVVSADLKIFVFVILLGEFFNALICGAFSGPHQRYQARLTWLIPLAALVLSYEVARKGALNRRFESRSTKTPVDVDFRQHV